MSLLTSLFDYHLPSERIAQHSAEPRDHARLMVLDRQTGAMEHKQFSDIVDDLEGGDLLVINDTKVFRARLQTTHGIEVFLLRAREGHQWETLMRPGKKVCVGQTFELKGKDDNRTRSRNTCSRLTGRIVEKKVDGVVVVAFDVQEESVLAFANEHGEIPVPPYISERIDHLDRYQTIYARETGSVAAPTAGFHFTQKLIERLKKKGVQFAHVTLHVGMGTFRPMKGEMIDEHVMHAEYVSIPKETANAIQLAKAEGRRVIAIGTTTVRTLEGVAAHGGLRPFTGDVNLFIKPGFLFQIIDGLVTNFHLPKSTLLVLVSAFAGREPVMAAYREAIAREYRFFSFGDAMFIR